MIESVSEPEGGLDPELLEVLVCPACRREVRQEGPALLCSDCGRRFPVHEGIPVLLLEEATPPGHQREAQ